MVGALVLDWLLHLDGRSGFTAVVLGLAVVVNVLVLLAGYRNASRDAQRTSSPDGDGRGGLPSTRDAGLGSDR